MDRAVCCLLSGWHSHRLYDCGPDQKNPEDGCCSTRIDGTACAGRMSGDWILVPAIEQSGQEYCRRAWRLQQPVRGRRLLQAVRQSGGTCVMVAEEEIKSAQQDLARHGIYIEPTSATAIAALKYLPDSVIKNDVVVVPLTGSGLKGEPQLNK